MLYGETVAVYSKIHKKHVNKAESYYRLRPYCAENSSLYLGLRLLTSSGGLWNSSVLIAVLPPGGGTWNSKHQIPLHLNAFYVRFAF
jgi:hypothetical protein